MWSPELERRALLRAARHGYKRIRWQWPLELESRPGRRHHPDVNLYLRRQTYNE
jgi:hypothetical protein